MLEKQCRHELKTVAEAYAKATNRSLSAISEDFYGKSTIFARFIDGDCSMTIRQYDRVMAEFRKHWPAGTPWPGTGNGFDE